MSNVITGTEFNIDVGKNYKGKLNIFGKTEQATRSGKNLFNSIRAKSSNVTIDNLNLSLDFSVNQDTYVSFDFNKELGKTYTLVFDGSGVSDDGILIFWLDGVDKSFKFKNGKNVWVQTAVRDNDFFTLDDAEKTNVTSTITLSNIMLLEGEYTEETVPDYEPYGASPSPEFPSEIENVEGKNLQNNNLRTGVYDANTGNYIENINYLANIDIVAVKPNTSYVFSSNLGYSFEAYMYRKDKTYIGRAMASNNKFMTSSEAYYINWRTLTSGQNNLECKIQLEKGTVATEYVPYNSLAVKVTGKNLARINDGNLGNNYRLIYGIPVKKGEKITVIFKGTETHNSKPGCYFYTDETLDGSTAATLASIPVDNTEALTVITMPNDGYFSIACAYGYQTVTVEKLFVGKGEYTLENYEPYKSQTAYFPLTEGQKLMEGSYLAEDGVHNTRTQVVFDGSENIDYHSQTINGLYRYALVISNIALGFRKVISNYFKQNTEIEFSKVTEVSIDTHPTSTAINFFTDFTTLDEFKTFLAEQYTNGTPVIIEYELAEEERVPYTATQQDVWNQMQEIYLFEGKNYFNNINKLEPELELEYLKIVEDCDCYISENGRFVIPEYGINYLVDFNASNLPSMPEAMQASVRIIGRDGDVPLNTTYEPIPFSVVCYTDDNLTPDEKVLQEQKINRFINSMKNNPKVFAFERENKFYKVEYSGVLTTIRFPAHVQFTIPLKSSDSYAMDLVKNTLYGNSSKISETIKETGAIFTIRGPALTPKISFNNYQMSYDNNLLEGQRLIIDTQKSTITHVNDVTGIKTNAMRDYNHEFPMVEAGENELLVQSGIDDASQVKVEWYDLKL